MRPLPRLGALVATVAVSLTVCLVTGPASGLAAPVQTLDPTKVPRGADITIAHLEGKTIVDGTTRLSVSAPTVVLLGKAGTGYVVATAKENGNGGRLLRLESTGAVLELGRGDPFSSVLSSDGQLVLSPRAFYADKTRIKVRSALTGATLAKRTFKGYPSPLDARAGGRGTEVLVAGFGLRGTQSWDTATGAVARLTRRIGGHADLEHDLLSAYTKDPYQGGCTVVSRVSDPSVRLWKSCDHAVTSFSTDGSHLATVDILSDGVGPNAVVVRTVAGSEVGSFKTKRKGYFGSLLFEGPTALLLETYAGRRTATIRCVATTCDRASEVTRGELYRAG